MIIGVHAAVLSEQHLEGVGYFTYEILRRLTLSHSNDTFIFFSPKPILPKYTFGPNVQFQILPIPKLLSRPVVFWLEQKVTQACKAHNVEVFFSPIGHFPLRLKIPVVTVIHDLNFEHNQKFLPIHQRAVVKYFFPKYTQKAHQVITVSEFCKQDIINRYNIASEKIKLAYIGGVSDNFSNNLNLDFSKIKQKYAGGNDYFITVGLINPRKNIFRLIKAFEIFKRNTNSSLKLIIAGRKDERTQKLFKLYNKLQFRKDIHFLGWVDEEDLNGLMRAATALIYVSLFEGFGIPLLEAMTCNIPIITSNITSMPEVAGDAAILVNPYSTSEISNAMMKISKDEELREQLITAGKKRINDFSWDKTASIISDAINCALKTN